jgi:hypothetical protein
VPVKVSVYIVVCSSIVGTLMKAQMVPSVNEATKFVAPKTSVSVVSYTCVSVTVAVALLTSTCGSADIDGSMATVDKMGVKIERRIMDFDLECYFKLQEKDFASMVVERN